MSDARSANVRQRHQAGEPVITAGPRNGATPLGVGSISVSPAYYQAYLGIGFGFEFMQSSYKKGKELEDHDEAPEN